MRNYIWINHTKDKVLAMLDKEGAYAVYVVWDDPSLEDVRRFINKSMPIALTSTKSRVMVLDAKDLNPRKFSLFLKTLERPDDNLYVSFFGAKLNCYPLTVISRCTVRMRHFEESLTEELVEKDKLEYLKEVELLRHYDVDTALRMVDLKPKFVDMLVRLENFRPERYSDIKGFQYQPVEFIYLFYEWMNKNDIFTSVDLKRCCFLRDEEIIRLLQEVSICDLSFESYVIDLLFVRKAMMNAY